MADDIKIIIGVDATPVERAVRVMDNLEAEVRKVERAEKAGLITKERAKAETDRLTASMQKLKVVANGSVSDFNKFEKGLYGSGKAVRRNEIAFQQAGYQIQDFIVQVQAGTNPLIAFSQQGSQLAGFFAGPWGASIGLGIAAVGALGTALMGTLGDIKSFEDQLKETTSSLEDYFGLLKGNKEPFGDAFDKATEKLVQTSEAYKDLLAIAKIEAFDGITKLNESLTESVLSASYLKTEIQDTGDVINQGFVAKISAALGGRAGKDIRNFYNALVQLREAPTLDAQYEAAIRTREIFKQNVDVTGELTDQQKQFWKELSTTIQKMELLGAATETAKIAYDDILGSAEGLKEATEALNEIDAANIEKVKDAAQKVEEGFRRVGEEQVKLFQAQGQHQEALKLAAQIAYDEAKARVLAKAETEAQKVLLMQSAEAAGELAAEAVYVADDTRRAKEEAKELAKALREAAAAMDALENFGTSIERKLEVAKAKGVALAKGLDEQVMGQIAGERFTAFEKYSEAMLSATNLTEQNAAVREYETALANITALEQQQLANAKKRDELSAAKKASSSTTDPITSGSEYIKRVLKPEIEFRQKAAFMSDEQRKRAEFEFELRQRIDKYKEGASEKEIQAAMTLYDQAVRLERVGDIIDYSQGQFENFFMTVVDGTTSIEDAFKGMLRNILLEIYKQQVAKPAAEGIGNLLRKGAMAIFGGGQTTASAYGNVFQNGSVKAFADGGIVSSPTFFPMSNGTGLMGEAGPEAIMPLKRGPNGKLGVEASGGQQVVVNQSFNFAANGDESVKKIIAQAAPQIAQMTQKQIMDSRRRGGQMKAAFS